MARLSHLHLRMVAAIFLAGAVYSSESPERRWVIRMQKAPDGGELISLSYQGINHEKGRTCPTCGGPAETGKP